MGADSKNDLVFALSGQCFEISNIFGFYAIGCLAVSSVRCCFMSLSCNLLGLCFRSALIKMFISSKLFV